jgi:hypothetical protein
MSEEVKCGSSSALERQKLRFKELKSRGKSIEDTGTVEASEIQSA